MVTPILRQALVVLSLGLPFALLELRFAAHRVSYRQVLVRDIGAYAVVMLLGIPSTVVLSAVLSRIQSLDVFQLEPDLPSWVTFPLAVLAIDFALYWTHRAIHTVPLWRLHRWHHSPRQMYWLAGARASFLQGLLYPIVSFFIIIALNVPANFVAAFAFFTVVANHWMHSNLGFKSRWLEAVLVTPRIHHVHHSIDPRHHNRNFGAIFSVWDRMFGTFFDPDDVSAPLEFGIPEHVSPPRVVVGV